MTDVLMLPVEALFPDPDNPRSHISPEDARSMADSIAAGGGVDQALIVVPDGDQYRVIDGHMRLAGARLLGQHAPAIKCEVRRDLDRRAQLLLMARTSYQHYAKDPISEARHFRILIDDHGLTRTELARAIGTSLATISGRLKWLELEPEILEHVARGRIPKDSRCADAFLTVPPGEARIRIARMLALRGAGIRGVIRSCERLNASLARVQDETDLARRIRQGEAPATVLAERELGAELPVRGKIGPGGAGLRKLVGEMCHACDVRQEAISEIAEPAWTLLMHASQETCERCSLRAIRDACQGCPLPELLARLARANKINTENGHVRHTSV